VLVKDDGLTPREQVLTVSIACWYMSTVNWCSYVTTWLKPLSPTPRLSWGRKNEVTQGDGRVSLSLIAKTSSGCRSLFHPSERLLTRTMWDVRSGTLHKSSVESVWRVDQVFPCRVYINSNCRDSRIWVSLVCDSHHIDNSTNLMSLLVIEVVLLKYT
jgi:hypothetical protein